MGTGNLPDLASSPTLVDATTEQYNAITDALQGHQVARDSNGVAEDNISDIGRPSSGRPRKLYLGTGLNVAGQDIDFSAISLETTGISSGKSKTSGFPNYLSPLGLTGTGDNTFLIEGSATTLEMTIDGQAYSLETDLESDDLALAPSANNTCTVDDSLISGDPVWSKTIGEFGYWMIIDATGGIGSEISALDGTVQCFKINNGADDEIFLAQVDTTNNMLIPILRGIGGTDRIAFSDADTITLLKAHYIFLDNDLATVDTTTTYPTWSATAPSAPATGDYWWDVTNSTWKRYSGASWEALGRIYLGYAICDDSDCLYVEHADYNLAWSPFAEFPQAGVISTTEIKIYAPLTISVAGTLLKLKTDITADITSDLEGGVSEAASTWYFVYIKTTGEYVISDKSPRFYGIKRGWYHPNEYWRMATIFFNGAGSDMQDSNHNMNAGNISFVTAGTINAVPTEVMSHFDIPAFIKSVQCKITLGATNGNTTLVAKEVSLNSVYFYDQLFASLNVGTQQLTMNFYPELHCVQNGLMIWQKTGSAGDAAQIKTMALKVRI